jgi:PBP1b-binding outer membrane lipoprotein LpoB
MRKKSLVLIAMVLGLGIILSACAGQMASESVSDEQAPKEPSVDADYYGEAEEQAASEEREYASGMNAPGAEFERMVIYNANMRIAVEDPIAAMESIIRMIEGTDGFVVYSNVSQYNTSRGQYPTVNLTVRVPAGQLDSMMDAIKNLTPDPKVDVLSENVSGQDVTSEYTDLSSRLRNLEAAEMQLVKLMDDARDPEDVLAIFEKLTYYRGEIEVVKGRMKYLRESTDLSSISLEIVAKESLQPIEIAGWEPKGTVKKAVEALIETGQFLVDGAIWLGIYCLPFLIPLGIGVYFLVRFLRKRKAKKAAEKKNLFEELEAGKKD